MFADAVRREAQRLTELLMVTVDDKERDKLLLPPRVTLEIVSGSGDVEEAASDASLLSAAAIERLVVDATAAQPSALLQLSSERLLMTPESNSSSRGNGNSATQQQVLLCAVSKCFVLHFAAPSTPRVDARGTSDSVDWTSFLSDAMRVRLHYFAVFPRATAAAAAATSAMASPPTAASSAAWRESAWRRRAQQRPDRLLEMELVAPTSADDSERRRRTIPRFFLSEDALPRRRLEDMVRAFGRSQQAQ
ncbi:hypothetical protein PINS_up020063 [Pythium insidiosum]|nr:hypothetical protein PINS_up020063 [Pythium insidiosum]